MEEQTPLSAFDREVLADREHGHVLLERPPSADGLKRARAILSRLGGAILNEKLLPPEWLIVTLEEGDIRNAVLALVESGFTVLKGANSLRRLG